ncbi:MAG: sugar phosphate isomerase/epimerase [Chloroflexi bacterium]|nr:sugar phosphate isomerase/epimerase [Chloroflexota bacterium]
MKLGVDSNSLMYQNFDIFGALDYAARAGLDTIQIHRNKLQSFERDYLRTIRARADELGLTLELAMGCIDGHSPLFKRQLGAPEAQLRTAIGVARVLGSSVVQVFIGNIYDRLLPVPYEQRRADVAKVIRSLAPLIEETGIRPAIENHGDATARELAALIEEIGPDYAGVCLDTGNPTVMAEDPALTTEILAPYTLMSHFRDNLVWSVADGAMTQWVPMGVGNTDLPRIAAVMKEKAPNTSFTLELITGGAPKPVPYLNPDAEVWRKYPHTPARDFARFVALAHKGPEGPIELIWRPAQGPPEGELAEQLKAQQLRHYAQSFDYCREVLGMGERRN